MFSTFKIFGSNGFHSRVLFYSLELVNGFRRSLFWSLILLFFLSLGMPIISVTTLFAISSIILVLFELPTGAFADYYSRRTSVLISFFLMFVSFLGFFLFENFWILAFCFVLQDIAWTFQSGATTAWIIDSLNIGKHQGKILSLFSWFYFFERVGGIFGGILGFFLMGALGFRFVWLVVALLNLFMFFILLRYMEEKFSSSDFSYKIIFHTFAKTRESLQFLFHVRSGSVRGLALALFLLTAAFTSVSIIAPVFLSDTLHMTAASIAGLPAIFGLFLLLSPFFGSRMAYRFGVKAALVLMSLVIGALVFLFAMADNVIVAVVVLLFFHFFDVAMGTVHDSVVQHSLSFKTRASIGSIMGIIWGVGHTIGSFFTGVGIVLIGIPLTLGIVAIVFIISAFVYSRSLR